MLGEVKDKPGDVAHHVDHHNGNQKGASAQISQGYRSHFEDSDLEKLLSHPDVLAGETR